MENRKRKTIEWKIKKKILEEKEATKEIDED